MKKLLQRFASVIKGTLSGFDRIVFKGYILPLMSAAEVMKFCGTKEGKRFRARDPTGKDREILQAIIDPAYCISGLTNTLLREQLAGSSFIGKRPRQNRYQLTLKGVRLTTLLNVILDASTENLMKMAA